MSVTTRVILDLEKTCRTCLGQKSTEELRSLLENNLNTSLNEVTNIELDLNSSLPTSICNDCVRYLNVALNFRKQVYNSETQLRDFIKNDTDHMTVVYKSYTVLDDGVISENCVENLEDIITCQNQIKENIIIVGNLQSDIQDSEQDNGKTVNHFFKDNKSIYAITEEITNDNSESLNYFVTTEADETTNTISNANEAVNLSKSSIVLNTTLTNVIKWAESGSNSTLSSSNLIGQNEVKNIGKRAPMDSKKSEMSFEGKIVKCEQLKSNMQPKDEAGQVKLGKSKKIVNFSCDLCSKTFRFEFVYKKHLLKHGTPICCEICVLLFNDTDLYLSHIKSQHKNYKPFACPSCEVRCSSMTSLKEHYICHTAMTHPKRFGCDICGKKFFANKSLVIHKKKHSIETETKCDICNKKLADRSGLRNHLKIHRGEKNHKSDICGSMFIHRYTLRDHLRTHTGEKPFTCKLCNNKFSTSSYLKIHLRIHNSEKPYMCRICPKSFVSKTSLAAHEKAHTGEKKYQCDFCGWRSCRSADLRTHIRKHTNERPYNCEQCGKCYRTASNLSYHRRSHSEPKKFICNICDKAFTDPRTLKGHIRIHTGETPYQCHICGHRFRQSGQLSAHRKTHQSKETVDNT